MPEPVRLSPRDYDPWELATPLQLLHFIQKLAKVLCQLCIGQTGKLPQLGRGRSRFGPRGRYGQRDLEQVEGARRRSLVRHAIYMGIPLPSSKPGGSSSHHGQRHPNAPGSGGLGGHFHHFTNPSGVSSISGLGIVR